MNAVAVYRRHFAEGRRYGLPAYALGAALRRRCAAAGALAVTRGLPLPRLEQGAGRLELGDVGLYPGVRLHTEPGARIAVGGGSYLNRDTLVWAAEEVVVGRDCMIAWDVILTDTEGFGEAGALGRVRPVRVGDGAWIGAKAVILAGADIGAGAVIAAGAVVREPVPAGAVVVAESARTLLDLAARS